MNLLTLADKVDAMDKNQLLTRASQTNKDQPVA